jgi:hypothetical protein
MGKRAAYRSAGSTPPAKAWGYRGLTGSAEAVRLTAKCIGPSARKGRGPQDDKGMGSDGKKGLTTKEHEGSLRGN